MSATEPPGRDLSHGSAGLREKNRIALVHSSRRRRRVAFAIAPILAGSQTQIFSSRPPRRPPITTRAPLGRSVPSRDLIAVGPCQGALRRSQVRGSDRRRLLCNGPHPMQMQWKCTRPPLPDSLTHHLHAPQDRHSSIHTSNTPLSSLCPPLQGVNPPTALFSLAQSLRRVKTTSVAHSC